MIDYNFLINQIQRNLPTLPTIVNELTNILQNPDSSTFAVEEVMTSGSDNDYEDTESGKYILLPGGS